VYAPVSFCATNVAPNALNAGLARLVAKMLDAVDPGTLQDAPQLRRFEKLESMHEKEGRAICALMRSLRLTNRSRYDAAQAHVAARAIPPGPRPWESG
jgi:hypothetical protein